MPPDLVTRRPARPARAPVTEAEREAAHVAATSGPAALRALVGQIRSQIVGLKREAAELAMIRANRAETLDLARAGLQVMAEAGAERLRAVVRNTSTLGYFDPTPAFRLPSMGPADLGPLLVALLGVDTVAAALAAHTDAVPAVPDAAARAARLAEIEAELFRLECEEEAAIEASEATDAEPIRRRVDADPRAVLGVPVAAGPADDDDDDDDDDEGADA